MAEKQKILIIDDAQINREMLADMLEDEFDILEAADGKKGIEILESYKNTLSLVLLDLVMPVADGFEVLRHMNENKYINDIPVIVISSETSSDGMKMAFELGVTDYITRPFDVSIVRRRVQNTISLYCKQKKLVGIVSEQVYEKEKNNQLMINILSHIVEFRNGESGQHVLHIRRFTDIILAELMKRTDRYHLTSNDAILIANASALHDIGKISVPDNILNKPGRFTPEEFAVMKTHSAAGAKMINDVEIYRDEPLIRTAYSICRWHHERYDGKGYPDGLEGDNIPIESQVVSIADVYDALTSERVYKEAYSHEKTMEMIICGECGKFNPLLIDCLEKCSSRIQSALGSDADVNLDILKESRYITEKILRQQNIGYIISGISGGIEK